MIDPVRQEVIRSSHTIVIKVGTAVISRPDGSLDRTRLKTLVHEFNDVLDTGRNLVLVSSGAIGAGIGQLGLKSRPKDLRHLQASAAVGQSYLIREYDEILKECGYHAAQILLTAADFDNRTRFLNVRNTILTLSEYDAVPIINENDTVSVEELRFGDNDMLAAMVTNMLRAPLLLILTSVDGLYKQEPNRGQETDLIDTVRTIDRSILSAAGLSTSKFGTGGMKSKVDAARMCTSAGESVWFANGRKKGIIARIMAGESVGTLFLPERSGVKSRARWIGMVRTRGKLLVDEGARRAVEKQGRSLLAIGVREISGRFEKGDPVSLCGIDGVEFARGLSNYSSIETNRVKGMRTTQIRALVDSPPYDEVIHRDNLVLKMKDL